MATKTDEITMTDLDLNNLIINLNKLNDEIKEIKNLKEDLSLNIFSKGKKTDLLDYENTSDFFDDLILKKQLKFQNYLLKFNKELKYETFDEATLRRNIEKQQVLKFD